jgi:hypothetical protein
VSECSERAYIVRECVRKWMAQCVCACGSERVRAVRTAQASCMVLFGQTAATQQQCPVCKFTPRQIVCNLSSQQSGESDAVIVATLEHDNMATRQRGKRDRVRGSSCVPVVRCCACDAHVAINCVLSCSCMQRALHKLTFTCGVRSGLDLSEHASVCGMISTVRGCAGVLAIAEASTVSTDACIIRARTRRRRLEHYF